jgi:hypothetical protein
MMTRPTSASIARAVSMKRYGDNGADEDEDDED